ncbi:Bas1p [Saccharomyces eubayanus]|uniref:Bas1p n=1 Tax=Saccharomyces eubayanus TaxID=1080349 RepID=UPI0006C5D873|nr:BAS1-like protein [Saccharomyces eubayanus]KOG98410.1 BAS1-like protein [Saccharomyces eubayanus]
MSNTSAKDIRKNKPKRGTGFDLLEVTESLGYQTHRKNGRNSWSKDDDNMLRSLVNESAKELGYENGLEDVKTIQQSNHLSKCIAWDVLATRFKHTVRTSKDVRKRWTGSLDPNLKKGKWTQEEDDQLLKAYEEHGPHWLSISMDIPGRTEDQCAKRYIEVLGPGSKGRLREWTLGEDLSLISKVKAYGTKWRKISSEMEFRPSLTCRNRWRKIITMVVRGQASEVITKAIKENKNIDMTDGKLRQQPIMDADIRSDFRSNTEENLQASRENKASLIKQDILTIKDNESSKLPKLKDSNDADSLSDSKQQLLPPLKDISVPPPIRMMQVSQPHTSSSRNKIPLPVEDLSSINKHSPGGIPDSPQATLPPTFNPASLDEHMMNNTGITDPLKQNDSTLRTREPNSSSTQWKFTLKDGQGLSISNGTIDSTRLVKELVDQAKKYSLKISIHQHIHNHYVTPTDNTASNNNSVPNTANVNGNSLLIDNFPHMGRQLGNGLSGLSSTNDTFSPEYRTSLDNMDNDFLSRTPNYNAFSLEPTSHNSTDNTNELGSQSNRGTDSPSVFYPQARALMPTNSNVTNNEINPGNVSTNSMSPNFNGRNGTAPSSTASYTTSGSEIPPDVGPNRITHFNYLPPTIRPHLGSSDATRGADLNKLLNPSPNSVRSNGSKSNQKEKKKSEPPGHHSSSSLTTNKFNRIDQSEISRTTSRSDTPLRDEDGLDFWETLRSLATTNPQPPVEKPTEGNETTSHVVHQGIVAHTGESGLGSNSEGYDFFNELLDKKADTLHNEAKQQKDLDMTSGGSTDNGSVLPLNPS